MAQASSSTFKPAASGASSVDTLQHAGTPNDGTELTQADGEAVYVHEVERVRFNASDEGE